MRLCYIHFGNLGIMTNHVQRSMSQKGLQREYITAGTQVSDGKCVPEFMWIGLLDFCTRSQPIDQHTQTVFIERSVSMADEEGSVEIVSIFTAGKITPNGFSGDLAQVNSTPFATFCTPSHPMSNDDLPGLEVNIVDGQRTQFGRAKSRIQQHQDNRLVPVCTRSAHHKLFPFFSLRFTGVDTSFENFFDVLFGEGLNRMFLEFRCIDFFCWIRELKFHLKPTKKGSKGCPNITDGLSRKRFSASIPTPRFVFGPQPGHITDQVGRLNFQYPTIPNVIQPMTEGELIGGDRAWA